MEADDREEPALTGQEPEECGIVSDDSDSREAIIELDQSQIASPSDSDEEESADSVRESESATALERETKEFFDNVSEGEDFPITESGGSVPEEGSGAERQVDNADSTVCIGDMGEGHRSENTNNSRINQSQGQQELHLTSEVTDTVPENAADTGQHTSVQEQASLCSESPSKIPCQSLPDLASSASALDNATVDSHVECKAKGMVVEESEPEAGSAAEKSTDLATVPHKLVESESLHERTEKHSDENVTGSVSVVCEVMHKEKERSIGGPDTSSDAADISTPAEAVSSASGVAESWRPSPSKEVTSTGDALKPAEASSEVSRAGDAPMSAVDAAAESDSQDLNAEALAAHQAEVDRIKDQLRELGAESVSDPESGEDMGSDDSSPEHIPDYGSPAMVTSSSRHSVGSSYMGRDHRNALPLERVSGRDHPSRSQRALSEGRVRPVSSSTIEDRLGRPHLSLSASSYMENISDDENIGDDDDDDSTGAIVSDTDKGEGDTRKVEETVSSSTAQPDEDAQKSSSGEKIVNGERVRRPIMIASLGNKQQVQTHFNEEQVELDYEDVDGEGDDVEAKDDEEDKEDGEFKSDKDEGELDDDDDCEEGEIKEPGSKKPYVKPLCRFYMRGACTWGLNCRFLHPGVNDKGNYQMIELPGRWNGPPGHMGRPPWGGPEIPEEPIDLPPPPEIPPPESAWERGLRHAKEQMKKSSQRKEQESNFEEKRLNLSVDEEREMNKENERRMVGPPKDPYYDQAYEEDEYYNYKPPGSINPWQSGRYENFEVHYNRERSYSPYGEKPYFAEPPDERYPPHPYSPPVDKFGRHLRDERMDKYRDQRVMEDIRSPSPPPMPQRRPADEWHDPWRRSKSPKPNRRGRSRSRSKHGRRSLSDSSFSSNSRSRSRSSFSRSSRSFSRSSFSSRSRSRSPEPAPPGVDRGERMQGSPPGRFMDQPRSAVSVRGRGGYWRNYDQGGPGYHHGGYNRGNFPPRHHQQQQQQQHPPERRFPEGYGYNRANVRGRPQERKIPPGALRPKPRAGSASSSGSSRSHSRSRSFSGSSSSFSKSRSRTGSPRMGRSRSIGSMSRSRSRSVSSVSSRTSSSSSSSSGSADSDNLYRDLGSPTRGPTSPKKKAVKTDKKLPDAAGRGIGERPPRRSDQMSRRPGASPALPEDRAARAPRPDRPNRPERPDRQEVDRAGRMGHPGRPDQSDRPDRGDRMENRPERMDRGVRAERGRRMLGRQPSHGEREQSSRPPPPAIQPKAKDPMKLVGLKSNIKLSLISKQPGDRPAQPETSSMKRRPSESGDGPPAKRPAASSPVKTQFEKAMKPTSRAERAKSPTEAARPPRSSTTALPAPAPSPASIPLPSSPTKAPSAKPRAPTAKPPSQVPIKPAPLANPPPAEPAKAAAAAPSVGAAAAKQKKSMSSRREELLKQLKAVEDAIARKKAKMQ